MQTDTLGYEGTSQGSVHLHLSPAQTLSLALQGHGW